MADAPHTIVATERAWALRVIVLLSVCTTVSAVFIIMSWPLTPASLLLVALSCAVLAIDVFHLVRGEISVGLVPIAISAIGPAAIAAYMATGNVFALPAAVTGFGVAGYMLFWFERMARANQPTRDAADGGTAIVLGCAVKYGKPSTTLQLRLDAAHALWQRHPGMRVIVTGGVSDPHERSEAAVMASCLEAAGIPRDQIIIEDRALNTEENLANARALIGQRGLASPVWLVTSDYHMWRAAGIARGVGIETVPCAAKTPSSSRLVQWCREVLVICFGS